MTIHRTWVMGQYLFSRLEDDEPVRYLEATDTYRRCRGFFRFVSRAKWLLRERCCVASTLYVAAHLLKACKVGRQWQPASAVIYWLSSATALLSVPQSSAPCCRCLLVRQDNRIFGLPLTNKTPQLPTACKIRSKARTHARTDTHKHLANTSPRLPTRDKQFKRWWFTPSVVPRTGPWWYRSCLRRLVWVTDRTHTQTHTPVEPFDECRYCFFVAVLFLVGRVV